MSEEFAGLRSQIAMPDARGNRSQLVTGSAKHRDPKVLPDAFTEHGPEKRLCFGVVVGHERVYGYLSIDELEEIRGPGGLTIERGLYWKPRPLKECC
ncbi:MAG: hypothetical protein ACHQ4J_15095 [Candidatus Binatia bacterium]